MKSKLRHGYATVQYHLTSHLPAAVSQQATSLIRRALTLDETPYCPTVIDSTSTVYLLLFNGGSPGNPGPGGSGAIVVRTGAQLAAPAVCWVGSLSLASKTTTNNLAENMGLLTGLQACVAKRYEPLYVIGDSAMIIRQQKTRTPPKAPHLKNIYWRSRRAADTIGVMNWHHHLRRCNKMADTLANLAMDTKCSTQVHIQEQALPHWHTVLQHLNTDFMHWRQLTGDDARGHHRDIFGNGTVKRQLGPGRQQQWTT
ncbi:unnamed protein product [Phytophthora lilii]|uniref:Unnamed protein product n=1 Tax=Phytophthora lilii TaxID=2077276 RepID=A0A9W7CQZ1_9STRA|nr:unnamed protein product [Phytophthora lilii]